jgi:hypothetical protein
MLSFSIIRWFEAKMQNLGKQPETFPEEENPLEVMVRALKEMSISAERIRVLEEDRNLLGESVATIEKRLTSS